MKTRRLFTSVLGTVLIGSGLALLLFVASQSFRTPAPPPKQPARAVALGVLPLSFEANRGQTDPRVDFIAQGRGYELFLSSNEAALLVQNRSTDSGKTTALHMKLHGAQTAAAPAGQQELAGKKNYLVGSDRAKWQRDVPLFAKVKYAGVYPGVDLVYYGNERRLEYDFVVAPGADARQIALGFEGAKDLRVDEGGDLVIALPSGDMRFHRPLAYQGEKAKQPIAVAYEIAADKKVRFALGAYDRGQTLVIDPILSYSTFIGGFSSEGASGIAVDRNGSAYIVGTTFSSDYPVTPGAFDTSPDTIVVTKLNPAGSALVYSTFIGGAGIGLGDEATAIAVNAQGQAIITGHTTSRDFPTTPNGFDLTCGTDGLCNQDLFGVNGDAFVTIFNAAGSDLVYSTYFGGTDLDFGRALAVDASGRIYLAGSTFSQDLPTSGGAQPACRGGTFLPCADGFVAKLDPAIAGPASLSYATYLGGNGDDTAEAIAVDQKGNAFITGATISTNFPLSTGAFDRTCGDDGHCDDVNSVSPGEDAFVTKLNSAGSRLLYSTYLGANGRDVGSGIAVDGRGTAYVTGFTQSTDFPTTPGVFSRTLGGIEDAFVTLVNKNGSQLTASTYLGGEQEETGNGIAIDREGNAYVVGTTDSPNFPVTPDRAFNFGGEEDAFVTKLEPSLAILIHSTFVGASEDDFGNGIALSRNGTYIAGTTHSPGFPTTPGAFDRICGTDGICNDDRDDVFVTKLTLPNTATLFASVEISETFLAFGAENVGSTSDPLVTTLTSTGDAPLLISSIVASGDFAQTNNCPASLPAGEQCQISVTFTPTDTGGRIGQVVVTDNAENSPQIITLNGTGISNAKAALSPGNINFGNVKIGMTSPPRTETVTSVGTEDLVITDVFVGPPFFQTNDCIGHPIPPGEHCTVSIVYKPKRTGGDFTIFQLSDNTSQFNAAQITGNGVP